MAAPTRATPGDNPGEGGQVLHVLVSGPDVHEAIALPEMGTLSLGRDDDADIRVPDPSASREHALLHVGATVEIEDLGSTNGTHVGATRIPPKQRVPLAVGQSVVIGGITLVLQQQYVRSTRPRVRSHGYFYDRLIEECARAEADTKTTLGLLRIRLGAAADESQSVDVVARVMRPGDLLAAYAPREYEVLLPDSGLEKCREIAASIGKALDEIGGGPRLGSACFPRDGASPGALMAHACAQVRGSDGDVPGGAVVCDPQMIALYQKAQQASKANATVLILGETGVGKEVLANYIHSESRRADSRFLSSTAQQWPRPCWIANSSDMNAGPLPGPSKRARVSSRLRTVEPCLSTRSVRCRCPCRPSYCAQWDRGKSPAWEARLSRKSTCGSLRPPIETYRAM
jgi:hypothetical protein